MPRLVLIHSRRIDVPSPDPKTPIFQLESERVANAILTAIRGQYRSDRVELLSVPILEYDQRWVGSCRVGDIEFVYRFSRGLFDPK
jgi:hypothetical protein